MNQVWDGRYFDVYHRDWYQGTVKNDDEFCDLMGFLNVEITVNARLRRIEVSSPALNSGRYDADQRGGHIVIDKAD
jgi:hypothetical protein